MKFKTFFISILLIANTWGFINILSPVKAHAAGLGFHLNISGLHYGLRGIGENGDMAFGLGIIGDTCVAEDNLFNYRFKGDYYCSLIEAEIHRFKLDNAFGFGLVKNKSIRLWMGPKLGFGVALTRLWEKNYYNLIGDAFIGVVIGLNYHITSLISLSIEAGYNCGTLYSFKTVAKKTVNSSVESSTISSIRLDQNHPYHEVFITFGFMFRIKDDFDNFDYDEQ